MSSFARLEQSAKMGDSGATILVKLVKADKMRLNARGDAPDPMAKFRINVGGGGGAYSSSKTLSRTQEPTWGEEFTLTVKDPMNSQLECSLWDESSSDDTTQQKFLGEVILNLAKLVPHNNVLIEQVFEIKQGKQHKPFADDKKATGKLKLGLKLCIPEEGSAQKAPSQPPSQPKSQPSSQPKSSAPAPPKPQPQPQPVPKAAPAPAPAPAQAAPKEENVKPSQLRKTRDPDLPKGMVPPVALPGQGKLFLTVHTVQNVPKSDSAYGAPPYPYMIVALEGATRAGRPYDAKARTVTRDKEENPSYGEKEFVFGVDNQAIEGARLHFKLFDWNRGKDEQAGSFLVNLAEIADQALDKQIFDLSDPKRGGAKVTGTNGSATRATVSMRWAPASGPTAPEPTAQPRSVPAPVATPKQAPAVTPKKDDEGEAQGSAPRVLSGNKRPAAPVSHEAPGGVADVGLGLIAEDGKIVVSQVFPGGPAANSNQIRPGDALIDVDGHDVVGRPLAEVQGFLRGERNSPITMIFRRGGGGDQIVVTLLRAGQGGKGPASEPQAFKSSVLGPSISVQEKSLLDSMTGLRTEFSSLSFLWGEPVTDAVQENMLDWKLNMLYGPKKDIPSEPTPLPPGIMQETPPMVEAHPGMRRSFNAALATGAPANMPIYRSFDQGNLASFTRAGGQPMRMSSEMRFPSVSPQARAWETPIYSNDLRFQSGGALGGMPSMPTFSYPVSTTGSLSMGGSMSGRPLTSMAAAQSNFPIRAAHVEGLMQPVDKNEMVC